MLLGGILIALLTPSRPPTGYLDPGNPAGQGTRALAADPGPRGQPVSRGDQRRRRAGRPDAGHAARPPPLRLVITSPYLLSPGQLADLVRMPRQPAGGGAGQPEPATLSAAPPARASRRRGRPGHGGGRGRRSARSARAARWPRRQAAGNAVLGGVLMRDTAAAGLAVLPGGRSSHPGPLPGRGPIGHPAGQRRAADQRRPGQPRRRRPGAEPAARQPAGSSGWCRARRRSTQRPARPAKSLLQEIPGPAYLVALQVFIAVVLAAVWRMRRLGPLVAEPLPVVVRASETVEGHGRLYRSRRSRDRAAAVLRDAARHRISARLALPATADAGRGVCGGGRPDRARAGRLSGQSCSGRSRATMRRWSRWAGY